MHKKILLLCCILPLTVLAQSTQTFDCAGFSFEYPESFSIIKTQDPSPFVLKMQSKYYELLVSYAKSGWPPNKNIWDDDVRERFINNYSGQGKIVSITKELIQIKDEKVRCLKIKLNDSKKIDDSDLHLKSVSYMFLNNSNLCVFTFGSQGEYSKESPTTYPDIIMKGLNFKKDGTIEDNTSYLKRMIIESINEVCPIRVNDCLTILQVSFTEDEIIYKVLMDNVCDGRVNYIEFKEEMCYFFSKASQKSFFQYLDKNGYSIVYLIYNENDQLGETITIQPQEVITYYQ